MPTALAASSILRCVSKAATAASIFRPNLVPGPFIFPILSQTDTTSRTRPPLHRQPFAIPRFPQNCLASCSNQSDGCHRRGNHRRRRKKNDDVHYQQGLRRDNAGDLGKSLSSQRFGLYGQSPALIVIEAHPPAAELFSKHPIHLAKIFNDLQ